MRCPSLCIRRSVSPISRVNTRTRTAAYLRHQRLWSQELPSVLLLQRPIVVLHNPGIQGIAPDALARVTWNLDEWRR